MLCVVHVRGGLKSWITDNHLNDLNHKVYKSSKYQLNHKKFHIRIRIFISFFRYFMTDRTENNRVFDTKQILTIATLSLIFNYSFIIGTRVMVVMLDLPGGIAKCSGISVSGTPWIMIITNVYHLTLIFMGISADVALNR